MRINLIWNQSLYYCYGIKARFWCSWLSKFSYFLQTLILSWTIQRVLDRISKPLILTLILYSSFRSTRACFGSYQIKWHQLSIMQQKKMSILSTTQLKNIQKNINIDCHIVRENFKQMRSSFLQKCNWQTLLQKRLTENNLNFYTASSKFLIYTLQPQESIKKYIVII